MESSEEYTKKIFKYRHSKASEILMAFETYCLSSVFSHEITTIQQYSVAYHLLLKIYWFYEEDKLFFEDIASFSQLLETNARAPSSYQYYVATYESCTKVQSQLFDSPVYLFNITDANHAKMDFRVINDAIELGIKLGFADLLLNNLGIAILLEKKSGYVPSNSYTISVLPGTVFFDLYDDVFKVCEMIIHECSHVYLNDLLAATEEYFENSILYWSVWKSRNRPIIGILHAAYAFSNVIIYYTQLLKEFELPPSTKNYILSQLYSEKAKLREALPQVNDAIGHLKNEDTRAAFYEKISLALQK
ncbi:aKG-HExxH-type peptide beta-hydroxylase [Spirosoma foliorum]|uniref:HEXXH motif domain-containing protein n=1 Tax=Spirosoma foliorum TaxID=2710596 RepID=A0A7G5GRH0_9BACT|nr:HEXXH motif-containing putative peptide modification protein [Spirosoma foliorum]QMW01462.1 hypothetical protein H3H32_26395 [Spirosoma foliorum]